MACAELTFNEILKAPEFEEGQQCKGGFWKQRNSKITWG